jgi:DNA (cytosine-5)-methyltransferase 1
MEKALQKSMFGHKSRVGEIVEPFIASGGWLKHQKQGTPGVKNFFLGDICKLKGEDILRAIGLERGELDCVCGSPPCQGFSQSGKRDVLDFRNSLVFQFARLVIELFPKTMIFENVPGILTMVTPDGIPVIDAFTRVLEDGGFAGLDAMRRTLGAQTGAVGLMRSRGTKRAARMVSQVKAGVSKQTELWGKSNG